MHAFIHNVIRALFHELRSLSSLVFINNSISSISPVNGCPGAVFGHNIAHRPSTVCNRIGTPKTFFKKQCQCSLQCGFQHIWGAKFRPELEAAVRETPPQKRTPKVPNPAQKQVTAAGKNAPQMCDLTIQCTPTSPQTKN